MSNVVPNLGNALPLVDDMRTVSQQHHRRVGTREVEILVDIRGGRPVLKRGPRLAAPLGARNLDRAKDTKAALDLRIHDTWDVSVPV